MWEMNMKKSIFMYLFFFAVLYIIFQYANEKAIFGKQDSRIVKLSQKLTKAKDSLSALAKQTEEASYFSLQTNDNAMRYIERLGMEAEEVQQLISDKIYDQNGTPGGNPIIPLKGVNGDFKINKIKFLNHRWIQADFSDGKNWGEMIIEYFFDENNKLELIPLSSLLYSGS